MSINNKNPLEIKLDEVCDNTELLWFIKSTSSDDEDDKLSHTFGSAVQIRLRSDKGLTETFLLTSAHVVRGVDEKNKKGYGPIHSNIYAWPSKSSASKSERKSVIVFDKIKPYEGFSTTNSVPEERRKQASSDWVLLQFKSPTDRDITNKMPLWGCQPSEELDLYGFPGGDINFHGKVVLPTKASGAIQYKSIFDNVVKITSSRSLPGFSGGGFFNKNTSEIIGIHHSKLEIGGTLQAISIQHILQKIFEHDFETVDLVNNRNAPSEPVVLEPVTNSKEVSFTSKKSTKFIKKKIYAQVFLGMTILISPQQITVLSTVLPIASDTGQENLSNNNSGQNLVEVLQEAQESLKDLNDAIKHSKEEIKEPFTNNQTLFEGSLHSTEEIENIQFPLKNEVNKVKIVKRKPKLMKNVLIVEKILKEAKEAELALKEAIERSKNKKTKPQFTENNLIVEDVLNNAKEVELALKKAIEDSKNRQITPPFSESTFPFQNILE